MVDRRMRGGMREPAGVFAAGADRADRDEGGVGGEARGEVEGRSVERAVGKTRKRSGARGMLRVGDKAPGARPRPWPRCRLFMTAG